MICYYNLKKAGKSLTHSIFHWKELFCLQKTVDKYSSSNAYEFFYSGKFKIHTKPSIIGANSIFEIAMTHTACFNFH